MDKKTQTAINKLKSFRENRGNVDNSLNAAYQQLDGISRNDYLSNVSPINKEYIDDFYNESLQEEQNIDENTPWYLNITNGISLFSEDFQNSMRMFSQKLADDIFVDGDLGKIGDLQRETEDLKLVKQYKDLYKQLLDLKDSKDPKDVTKINDVLLKINQLDLYFKGDGRHSNVISELMYNPDNLSTKDKIDINALYATRDAHSDSTISNIFGRLIDTADWALTTTSLALGNITRNPFNIFTENGYKTREVVKNIDSFANVHPLTVNHLMETLYKGSDQNKSSILESINDKRIQDWLDYNDLKLKEKTIDLSNSIDLAKNGKLKYYIPSLGLNIGGEKGFDIFDPEDIPEQFKKDQEKYSGGFLSIFTHPLYTFPEVASTIGLFKHQLGAMAGDAAVAAGLKFIAKKYPVFAVSSSLGAMSGKATLGDKIQAAATTAIGLDASVKSRKDETALEAIQGQNERVLKTLQGSGIDIDNILNQIRQYATNKLHLDVSKLDDLKLLELGTAYNVPINDPLYNAAFEKSKKGLNKLINENNALALHDYLQTLPFLSYGGSALKRVFLDKGLDKVYNIGSKVAQKTHLDELKPIITNITGKVLDKIAIKDLGKLNMIAKHPKLGLMSKHIGQHALKVSKLYAYESLMEGAEEGVQEILQSRYQRGEYDDYSKPYRMFDPESLYNLPGLYKDATFDYFGINPNDPDNGSLNIRKAWNIGISSSMMFSAILKGLTNVRNNIHDANTRLLIAQLKADNIVGNMAASYAKAAQDQSHIGIFFDSFAKNNKSAAHIIKSLSDLKNAVDEENTLVKKSDVEADMKLANAAWNVYNNQYINEELKNNGIAKNSDDHKQLVINGTTAIVDAQMNMELINEERKKHREFNKNHLDLIDMLLDPELSKEKKLELIEKNPHTVNMIEQFRKNFSSFNSEAIDNIVTNLKKNIKYILDVNKNEDYLKWLQNNNISLVHSLDDESFKNYAKYKYTLDILKSFLTSVQKENDFSKNRYIRTYINSKLTSGEKLSDKIKEYWNDERLRNEAIDQASQNILSGRFDESLFVKNHINAFSYYVKMKKTKQALDEYKDQLERTKAYRKITGLDINTDKLEGIVVLLLKEYDSQLKREDIIVNGTEKNRVAKGKERTFGDLFDDMNIQFDDQKEFEDNLAAIQLNSAALIPQLYIALIYKYGTSLDISDLQEAIYGTNLNTSIINQEVSDYLSITQKLENFENEDDVTDFDPISLKGDMQKLSKKAAWKIIKDQIKDAKERRLVARRNFAEDLSIPEEDIVQSDEENTQQSETENQENKRKKKFEKSDAEKAIEENLLHGKTGGKTGQEIIDNKRKRKQNTESTKEESDDDFDDDVDDDNVEGSVSEQTIPTDPVNPVTGQPVDEKSNREKQPVLKENQKSDHVDSEPTEDDDDSSYAPIEDVYEDDPQNDIEELMYDLELLEIDEDLELELQFAIIENIDDLDYDEESGLWSYEDEELSEELSAQIDKDLFMLGVLETSSIDIYDLPDGTKKQIIQKRLLFQKDDTGDLVSRTFFYQPESEDLIKLNIKGKLPKPLASGKQLSEKLKQHNWLKSTKKYYIVSKSQESETAIYDIRDALTVCMVIEDDTNCYVVSLRSLGATKSEIKNKRTDLSEEEQKYLDSWYELNKGGVLKNAESDLRAWLETKGVDWDLVFGMPTTGPSKGPLKRMYLRKFRLAVMEKAKELAFYNYISTHPEESKDSLKSKFEKIWRDGPARKRNMSDSEYRAAVADYNRRVNTFVELAKKYFTKEGKTLLTRGLIANQIDKLRAFRNEIIDAYCIKKQNGDKVTYELPDNVRTDVTPIEVRQSNGSFDNVKKDGERIFRSIVQDDATLEQIQLEIESGDLQLGFGRGFFGGDPFVISNVFDSSQTLWDHKGASGKIFWFVDSIDSRDPKVPTMLTEELFDYQIQETQDGKNKVFAKEDSFKLCLGFENGKLVNTNTEGYKPSAAEILLYMLCEKFDTGVLDREKYRSIVEFFIHNGENTLIENQSKFRANPISQFTQKQLAFRRTENENESVLIISMPKDKVGNKQTYEAKRYTMNELFGEGSEETRLNVVKAIANQMHWNTDIAHMNGKFNVLGSNEMSTFVRYMMQQYGKDSDNIEELYNDSVSILGCEQLSFKMSDFFDLKNGRLVAKNNVSITAWMLKNKKLKTDLSENIFKWPWVFGQGVNHKTNNIHQETTLLDEVVINEHEDELDDKPKGKIFNLFDLSKLDWFMDTDGIPYIDELNVANTKEAAAEIIDQLNNTTIAKLHGGVKLSVLFIPPENGYDVDVAYDEFLKKLKEFIINYNTTVSDEEKISENISDIKRLISNGGTKLKRAETIIKDDYSNNNAYIIVTLLGDGNIYINPKKFEDDWKQGFTGIYSKTKSGRKFDEEGVRKWLADTLGLGDNQVLISAIMKSCLSEKIFGLTNVYTDTITNSLIGYVHIDPSGGFGVTYHEAWHYVNLLIHNKKDRMMIYNDYLKSHKKLKRKGVTFHDVEERMAEDFRKYVETATDKSIFGKVKRAFNRILDFVLISRRKSLYRNIFKAIQQGAYAKSKMGQQLAKEFAKIYEKGIPSGRITHRLPLMTYKQTKNLNVNNYHDYYEAFRSISTKILLDYNITTADELLSKVNGSDLSTVIETIEVMLDEVEENEYEILEGLKKNKGFLRKMLMDSLTELGFKAEIKKAKQAEDPEDEHRAIGQKNSYDQVKLTESKKDNAAIETKLFFRTIRLQEARFKSDGSIYYIPITDKYNNPEMYSFDETWNLLLNELFDCKSFSEMEDGQYKSNSIMGRLEKNKNISAFWNSVYNKFKTLEGNNRDLSSIQMRSQILSTLCSNKAVISKIELTAPFIRDSYDIDDDYDYEDFLEDDDDFDVTYQSDATIRDREKLWNLMNDNALLITKSIPRRWSKNLVQNGFVKYNKESGKTVINKQYVDLLKSKFDDLKRRITASLLNTGQVDYNLDLYGNKQKNKLGIIPDFISMLNFMGMPIDVETLNVFISMASDKRDGKDLTNKEILNILNKIFTSTSAGSIGDFVQTFVNNIGNDIIKTSRRNDRLLDDAYVSPKKSQIGLLALSYNTQHPNLADYTVKGTNGESYYPINQNNEVNDKTRDLNNKETGLAEDLRKYAYSAHSIILDACDDSNENDPDSQLRLCTFVGMKDAKKAKGVDYFGVTAIEDYLAKMLMTESDHIIFPTMADKKTWYSLHSSNIRLVHDNIIKGVPERFKKDAIFEVYEQIKPFAESGYNNKVSWSIDAKSWYKNLLNSKEAEDLKTLKKIDKLAKDKLNEHLETIDTNEISINSFSNNTLQLMCNYFLDELDTVTLYYSRANVEYVVKNKNRRVENYHGNVKDERLDFSGNGGKFRYFYDVITFGAGNSRINLNQRLESLFELQKKIEDELVKDKNKKDDAYKFVPESAILELDKEGKPLPLDGFELVRKELQNIRKQYVDNRGFVKELLTQLMNEKLMRMVDSEMEKVTTENDVYQLGKTNELGAKIPLYVPELLLERYNKAFQNAQLTKQIGSSYASDEIQELVFYALIANYTVNSMISTIEVEKIYTGDPAFFKWKKTKDDEYMDVKVKHSIVVGADTIDIEDIVSVENLDDTFSDKIKRLGGVLSPGSEMRLDYSDIETSIPGNEGLNSHEYSVLNVEDIKTPSSFLEEIYDNFKRQLIVDEMRSSSSEWFYNALLEILKDDYYKEHENVKDKLLNDIEYQIDNIYNNDIFYNNLLKYIPTEVSKNIEQMLEKQMDPYKGITVADALVYIRADLYRKIKIGLGEWSFKPNRDGYCDEVAYNIIENNTFKGKQLKDGEWLSNEKLYKYVKKFQANALKMSYYQNMPSLLYQDVYINKPIYNKMALFPLFKFHRSTNIGRVLYDRMNDLKKGCIDMIAFKSAVKVGAVQSAPQLVDRVKSKMKNGVLENKEDIKKSVTEINDIVNLKSDKKIDYTKKENNITVDNSENTLPLSIQSLDNLRLQLNTHAHDTTERNIGSQMFKLAFSNIIDDALYGTGKSGRKPRKGSDIKRSIMKTINVMTDRGIEKIKQRFYITHTKTVKNQDGTELQVTFTTVDNKAIVNWVKDIIESNGLGVSAEDIIMNGGIISSLVNRTVFEQSACSYVTSQVVDIKTKGGTAIQQSMYGFAATAYKNKNVSSDSEYLYEEDEKIDKLIHTDTKDLNLSVGLLKQLDELEIYSIKDIIENKEKINNLSNKLKIEIDDMLESLNLSYDTPTEFERNDLYTEYNGGKELKWSAKEGSMEILLSMNFFKQCLPSDMLNKSFEQQRQWLIDHDIIKGLKSEEYWHVTKDGKKIKAYSNPKPFGIGYRIPTQGMSSMFAFIVADVLPEQVGDLIIVPREFTAQTGSDFDVDKLFLATFSYKDGKFETKDEEGFESTTALSNKLLADYIDIITDKRNYANSRASIDVITDIVKSDLLSVLRTKNKGYRVGLSLLTPSFLCMRKREFGVGKDGIGPFALNITNMALTLFVHLTFNYGTNEYEFGDLDAIYGEDKLRISDWLSAMVNAHVDVAKDAYVFDLNVNKATYNHCNFMLRAGKGKQTFLLLAQPSLKQYAERVLNGSGVYGKYIDLENGGRNSDNAKKRVLKSTMLSYLNLLKDLFESNKEQFNDKQTKLLDNVIHYYSKLLYDSNKLPEAYKKQVDRIEHKNVIFNQTESENENESEYSNAFNIKNRSVNAIQNIESKNIKKRADALIWQLYSMEAFKDMDKYAEAISELVQCSKIDTKKFGNNIVSMLNYRNNMMHFKYSSNLFTINDPEFLKTIPKKKNSKTGEEEDLDASVISKYALERYFKETFLDKKFDAALKYTKVMLTGLSFKSTKIYEDIFMNVMRNIQGEMLVEDTKGNIYYGYKRVYNDDVVQAIGNAIDDILRFNTFLNTGYESYKNEVIGGNHDCIDFTHNSNIEEVMSNFDRLINGVYTEDENGQSIKEQGSIFERLLDLIEDIKTDGKNKAYIPFLRRIKGMIEVKNDLLNYLQPILPNETNSVGRMLLQEAQHVVKGDRKSRLISAFSELLSSTDDRIRNLAYDLVEYAYYSTYDLNVRNSFFDLVPSEYRAQYDVSLKTALTRLKNDKTSSDLDIIKQLLGITNGAEDYESIMQSVVNKILTVMSRNYWYSDEYVQPFMCPVKSKSGLFNVKGNSVTGGTVYGYPQQINENGDKFPSYIASTRISNETAKPLYIKVLYNGRSMLYKKSGQLNVTEMKEKGPKVVQSYSVYIPTHKAGLHVGKNNQYELYAEDGIQSIFKENQLPNTFAEDVVRKEIEEFVSSENNKIKDGKFIADVIWDTEEILPIRISTTAGSYYESINSNPMLHGVGVFNKKDANKISNANANIIINLTAQDTDDITPNISKAFAEKTVNVTVGSNYQKITDKIRQLSEGNTEDGVVVSFSTSVFDNQWEIPESFVEKCLDQFCEEYKDTINKGQTNIDEIVQSHKESIKHDYATKDKILRLYMQLVIDSVLNTIESVSNIKQVYSSINSGKSSLSFGLIMNLSQHRSNFTNHVVKILIDENMINGKSASDRNKKIKIHNIIKKQLVQEIELLNAIETTSNNPVSDVDVNNDLSQTVSTTVTNQSESAEQNLNKLVEDTVLKENSDEDVDDYDDEYVDEDIDDVDDYDDEEDYEGATEGWSPTKKDDPFKTC